MATAPEDIVAFWREAGPKAWFVKSDSFDADLETRFLADVTEARVHGLDDWLSDPVSSLALILLLDQFPRNIFRGTPAMFRGDGQARSASDAAIRARHDVALGDDMCAFVYMPFMHSEDLTDQNRSVELFESLGVESNLKHAHEHRDIIARYGRFPHRNSILGRPSTPEEDAYLSGGGFKG